MALVQVEDRRLEPEGPKRAHAADPEHELLAEPLLAVAAVQRPGDAAGALGVALDVRVEQVEPRAAHVRAPDPHRHVLAVEQDADDGLLRREGEPRRVVRRIALDLPAGLVEPLAEVALAVEQPDADERDAEVGGGLEMVAGEHAEAARVDRQALVEPELRREVGDQEVLVATVPLPPRLALELVRGACARLLERDPEARVVGGAGERVVGQLGEEGPRVALDALPRLGIEPLEQRARGRVPAEGEVPRPAPRARRGRTGDRSRLRVLVGSGRKNARGRGRADDSCGAAASRRRRPGPILDNRLGERRRPALERPLSRPQPDAAAGRGDRAGRVRARNVRRRAPARDLAARPRASRRPRTPACGATFPRRGGFAVICPGGMGRRLPLHSWGWRGQIADLARMPSIAHATLPWLRVDPGKVYAVGGSMGGHETLLLLGQYPRVLAGAVAFDSVTNFYRRYGDFGLIPRTRALQALARVEVGGTPQTNPRGYVLRSPSHWAPQIARLGRAAPALVEPRRRDRRRPEVPVGPFHNSLRKLGPRGRVEKVTGSWLHTAESYRDLQLPAPSAGSGSSD